MPDRLHRPVFRIRNSFPVVFGASDDLRRQHCWAGRLRSEKGHEFDSKEIKDQAENIILTEYSKVQQQ